jgi:hypothetical protein
VLNLDVILKPEVSQIKKTHISIVLLKPMFSNVAFQLLLSESGHSSSSETYNYILIRLMS